MLTLRLIEQTIAAIVDADGRSFADSGEYLRRGTAICRRLGLPLHDSLPGDEIGDEVHHLGHSKDSGMVAVDDAVTNSGEVARSDAPNRER
jgi:hypothetical protein